MKKGFTLIELLVVVLIIGILSAVALPQYTKAVARARLVEEIVQGRALLDAMNRYKLATGEKWTEDLENLDIELSDKWECSTESHYCGYRESKTDAILEVSEYRSNEISLWCVADKNYPLAEPVCRSLTGKDPERQRENKKYYLIYE
ncbi:MAG: type II secretion system protein [Elusimicrobiaceae bacterium]|nr:type II secretion system protein [Elusimicrobiaceae bacterium]